MKTWWLYDSSYRFKTCSKTVRRMLDKEYKLDVRNERPTNVRGILWRAQIQLNKKVSYDSHDN
jgi:hypothetical protein